MAVDNRAAETVQIKLQVGGTSHAVERLPRPAALGGQPLELFDERAPNLLAHHAVEILRVRTQLLELGFRHFLMRLRTLH